MGIDSLILTIIRLFLGIIFLVSFIGKANEPRRFATTLAAFKLIPNAWVQPVALTLMSLESVVAILLIIGWQTRGAAILCGFLLVIFTFAISLSLLRGQTDLECGCFGAIHSQKINLKLINRNISLLIATICIILWGGGLLALDSYTLIWKKLFLGEVFLPVILIGIGVLILYMLANQLYRLLLIISSEE